MPYCEADAAALEDAFRQRDTNERFTLESLRHKVNFENATEAVTQDIPATIDGVVFLVRRSEGLQVRYSLKSCLGLHVCSLSHDMNGSYVCLSHVPFMWYYNEYVPFSIQQSSFPDRGITYRGGTIPDDKLAFFEEGKKFRTPAFVATSFKESVADKFIERALPSTGTVKWIFELDRRGAKDERFRCCHINLVETGKSCHEWEYLFTAYSVFTVKKVRTNTVFYITFSP